MAYNLYQVQMAQGWKERLKKEDAQRAFHASELRNSRNMDFPMDFHQANGVPRRILHTSAQPRNIRSGQDDSRASLVQRLSDIEAELKAEKAKRATLEREIASFKGSKNSRMHR
mmetsp:Transcript_1357/g.1932  ORF Transcript_1357/g.1932 Transcript_1357/m.1932 type:complete len:114 (-) Transcript_1357:392-733(-)|eukprot:CAMPEP_0196594090 /NCGR_PEP_ID=MMETSP1081-20130531/77350_1 /TAXON_ID=36882 /ORGANISM="Pyramimonas amylifera, Strain CCMP720" /LENGTH=113 /DNA_ID=CAMNT_0041918253 /DNA_START=192 /DNA_END=533 /DNA_ORIENTATION=+